MAKHGSSSHEKIWEVVSKIPRGKVASYGEIARIAGLGPRARLVGYALHALPPGFPLPWHRVINARGAISFPRESASYRKQKKLLESEGVKFHNGAVDFGKFGWKRSS